MNKILQDMSQFSAAEEFFDYLGAFYEPAVMNVSRLHILKRFNQYLSKSPAVDEGGEPALRVQYRQLLEQSYLDFVSSSPIEEKVFKVFQDAAGTKTISVQRVRDAIADRQHA